VEQFIDAHAEDALSLGKALVIEEFGKQDGNADPYFESVYAKYLDSVRSGGPIRGESPVKIVLLTKIPLMAWHKNNIHGCRDEAQGLL
jgi:hypothetical protein